MNSSKYMFKDKFADQELMRMRAKQMKDGLYHVKGCIYRITDGQIMHVMTTDATLLPAKEINLFVVDSNYFNSLKKLSN